MRRIALLLPCLVVAATVTAEEKPAQAVTIESLQQQVEELRARVERLEAGQSAAAARGMAVALDPVPGGWRREANWLLLAAGMEMHDVEAILGEPDVTRRVGKFRHWQYGEDGLLRFYFGRLKSWETASGLTP